MHEFENTDLASEEEDDIRITQQPCVPHLRPIWPKPFKQILCSELPLKFFVCLLFGLWPLSFKKHGIKRKYSFLTILLAAFHWSCFFSYIYFVSTYWNQSSIGPTMPNETKAIQMGLVASGAFTFTVSALFFYSNNNKFQKMDGLDFGFIPQIRFALARDNLRIEPSKRDWLMTNLFLLAGFAGSTTVILVDFYWNTFFDFQGIHDFINKLSTPRKIHYYLSVCTECVGFYATACAVCIFHAVSCDLIRHIDHTENHIVTQVTTREGFLICHQKLYEYGKKLMASVKVWFTVHTLFFFLMVTAIIFEWFELLQHEKKFKLGKVFNQILVGQISGSLLIAFKFSLPFISASRVTARYSKFYSKIAFNPSNIQNLPELTIFKENSGVKIFGVRITTSFALLTLLCSFLGAMKFIAGFKLM